ncbi:MAG: GntR family transcriptional regulator [Methyloligellaceae bacterium]
MLGRSPKYMLLADTLTERIKSGEFNVGDLLPTEHELVSHYGVSRHTARHAISELRARGLVLSRQGRGSEVLQKSTGYAFTENIQSIEELILFATESRLFFGKKKVIQVNRKLADRLGCCFGRRFVRLEAIRRKKIKTSEQTIAVAEIFLDELYASVIDEMNNVKGSTAVFIAEKFGFQVQEVEQEISATLVDGAAAKKLNVPPNSPGLVVTRKYYANDKHIFLIAVSTYDAAHAKFSSRYSPTASGS